MKVFFAERVKRMSDEQIMEALQGKPIHDWRAWGDNIERIIAAEANRRGLID